MSGDSDHPLRIDLSLQQILLAEAGEDAVYVVDGESVDRASDYEAHLVELDRISGGALRFRGCTATEGETREIVVLRDHLPDIRLSLQEENGWIDTERLVTQLDEALVREGATSLFYGFTSRDLGQEVGFVYLPKEIGDRIAELVRDRMESDVFENFSPADSVGA